MSTNPVNNLTAAQLRKAADLREQIEAMEAKLQALLSGGDSAPSRASAAAPAPARAKKKAARKGKKGKRVLSPEALERIRAGQAKRWAKARTAKPEGSAPKPPKKKKRAARKAKSTKPKPAAAATAGKAPKRKMSAEGRARIQAAVKARWARERAAKEASGVAPKKKAAGKRGKKKAS